MEPDDYIPYEGPHEIHMENGLYWCQTEDVNSDECSDLTRCEYGCVCNDRSEGAG